LMKQQMFYSSLCRQSSPLLLKALTAYKLRNGKFALRVISRTVAERRDSSSPEAAAANIV
jgi:hypothetical protein